MKRELSCSYIYTDGTLVQVFDERRNGISICQTVDITLGYCEFRLQRRYSTFNKSDVEYGRIIIGRSWSNQRSILELAKGGAFYATMPDVNAGSEKTKSMGIKVQYVNLETASGFKLDWCETPELISGHFCLQEVTAEQSSHADREVGSSWAGYRVMKVRDLRKKEAKATAA